jgi:lactoylglutathione lyase
MTEKTSPTGLFEAHLAVSDLSRAVSFYQDVVGLEVAFEAPERGAVFLWVGVPGGAMIGLWSLGSAPFGVSLHIAFKAPLENVVSACTSLRSRGVTPLSFFTRETDEPSVVCWMPAAAVYFRDPDGHLLEYLAMLDAEPRPELGILPWSEWTSFAGEAPVDRYAIKWHRGSRSELRNLFELADDSPEQIDSYIDLGRVLVARDDVGGIVGHLQLLPGAKPDAVEIKSLAVHPSFRRRGIGRRLVGQALALCRAEQIRIVTVMTATADIANLRFYQRSGFRAASILRDAFTPETGYAPATTVDSIPLRDGIHFDLTLDEAESARARTRPTVAVKAHLHHCQAESRHADDSSTLAP